MTYTPSETERSLAAAIQLMSTVLFFIPAAIILRTRWRKSPYILLWAKANLIWSLFMLVPAATLLLLDLLVGANEVYVVVWCAHVMMVVVCAFASMFNRPIGYFIITRRYCQAEMAGVFGAALAPDIDSGSKSKVGSNSAK